MIDGRIVRERFDYQRRKQAGISRLAKMANCCRPLSGGIFGNWYYQDEMLLVRVIGLLAIAAVAILVALQTERGRAIWALLKGVSKKFAESFGLPIQETTQTTMVVLLFGLYIRAYFVGAGRPTGLDCQLNHRVIRDVEKLVRCTCLFGFRKKTSPGHCKSA